MTEEQLIHLQNVMTIGDHQAYVYALRRMESNKGTIWWNIWNDERAKIEAKYPCEFASNKATKTN